MFQVLLQYLDDRFASFYAEEPLSNYNELLDRPKNRIPVLQAVQGVDNEEMTFMSQYMYVDGKTNVKGNQTTVKLNFAVLPVRTERIKKSSRSPSSQSSVESELSPERKHKRRKKKSHRSCKKSRSKKSRKKHRKYDSSSESEDGHNLWKPRCSQTKM